MRTMRVANEEREEQVKSFVVIHPLDDTAETKVSTTGMGLCG